jgi:chromatin assembly factor 1 subunit B
MSSLNSTAAPQTVSAMANTSDTPPIAHIRAKTLALHWHEGAAAIYSVAMQPSKPGARSARLVTGGGDNNVRIWEVDYSQDGTEVSGVKYLSSITKHTQAVNCVRFNPDGTLLATASDDGTIMIWEQADKVVMEFGQDPDDEVQESWIMKIACFASNMSEIYDLCWSPDSKYICCGLMDNIIRIFSVSTGAMINQIAEHSHYVQGVAWDPRGDYICSQSADRSVHVYKLNKGTNQELVVSPTAFYKSIKSEVPVLKLSSLNNDKKKEEVQTTPLNNTSLKEIVYEPIISTINAPFAPNATPSANSSTLMEPPVQATRHKRTYSNSSTSSSHSIARCHSPLPMPLPAVMPSSPNHKTHVHQHSLSTPLQMSPSRSQNTTSNPESATENNDAPRSSSNTSRHSTPASTIMPPTVAYKQHYLYHNETLQSFFRRLTFSPDGALLITTCGIYKPNDNAQNTVYVYIRAGLNRGPVVHLPGLKKPAIAVRFSPIRYKLLEEENGSIFSLRYRMLFAVATQDSILIYDTQRLKCVAIVTGIHYAVITDVSWSGDGRSVFVSSNDGFISSVVLSKDIVGEIEGGFTIEELTLLDKENNTASASARTSAQIESSPDTVLPLTPANSVCPSNADTKIEGIDIGTLAATSNTEANTVQNTLSAPTPTDTPKKEMDVVGMLLSGQRDTRKREAESQKTHLSDEAPAEKRLKETKTL